MKQMILTWLNKKESIYNLAVRIIANRIIREQNLLTPQYLLNKGWIEKDGFYFELHIKDRDLIFIKFSDTSKTYNVLHSSKKTFITCQSKLEWFEMYYLLISDDNLYILAGI